MNHIISNIDIISKECEYSENLEVARIFCGTLDSFSQEPLIELIEFFQVAGFEITIHDDDDVEIDFTDLKLNYALLANTRVKIDKKSNNKLIFTSSFNDILSEALPEELFIFDNFSTFSSFATCFLPYGNNGAADKLNMWKGEKNIKKYVNNYSSHPIDFHIASILLKNEPLETSKIFESWASNALDKQLISLSTQYESHDANDYVIFRGDSCLKLQLPYKFNSIDDFITLNNATTWVYSISKDVETKHNFFNHFAANIVSEKSFLLQLETVLERSQTAFKHDILKQNKEVIELVNTANKLVIDEVTSINQKIHDAVDSVLRNILTFVAVLVLQVIKDFNTSMLPFIYNTVFVVIGILFILEFSSLLSFNKLVNNLLVEKKNMIYSFMSNDEFEQKVQSRVNKAIYRSYFVYCVIFCLYIVIYFIFRNVINSNLSTSMISYIYSSI
jgi:hypothetical protein